MTQVFAVAFMRDPFQVLINSLVCSSVLSACSVGCVRNDQWLGFPGTANAA